MEQQIFKLSNEHDRKVLSFSGAKERGHWERAIPRKLPKGYIQVVEWVGDKLVIEPRPAAKGDVKTEIDPEYVLRTELQKLSRADLETKAVENGLLIDKNDSNAQIIGELVPVLLEKQKQKAK